MLSRIKFVTYFSKDSVKIEVSKRKFVLTDRMVACCWKKLK